MRLIDADKMLLELDCERRMSCDGCPFLYGGQESGCALNNDEPIDKWIEAQPTVEAEPVRHGRWILKHEGYGHYWRCSACNHDSTLYLTRDVHYCPYCGARMDGGEADDQ